MATFNVLRTLHLGTDEDVPLSMRGATYLEDSPISGVSRFEAQYLFETHADDFEPEDEQALDWWGAFADDQ